MPLSFRASSTGALACIAVLTLGCSRATPDAVPAPDVIGIQGNEFQASNAAQFPLVKLVSRDQPLELDLNAVVDAETGRQVQVVSPFPGQLVQARVQLGDRVDRGEVLGVVRSPDVQQAYSDLHTAQADAELAQSQLARDQDLLAHGAAAPQDVEIARNNQRDVEARLTAARQKLVVWGLDPDAAGEVANDEYAVRAPRPGIVIAQNAAGGALVPSADNSVSLFTLADLSEVWVDGSLYENDLGQAAVGDSAEVTLAALPNQVLHGRVAEISDVFDPTTRSAKVRVVLPNPDLRLRPGMFAGLKLFSQRTQAVVLAPQNAVVRSEDHDYVYVSEGHDRFRKVEVEAGSIEPGPDGAGWMALGGPVRVGDVVVGQALQFESAAEIGAGS